MVESFYSSDSEKTAIQHPTVTKQQQNVPIKMNTDVFNQKANWNTVL